MFSFGMNKVGRLDENDAISYGHHKHTILSGNKNLRYYRTLPDKMVYSPAQLPTKTIVLLSRKNLPTLWRVCHVCLATTLLRNPTHPLMKNFYSLTVVFLLCLPVVFANGTEPDPPTDKRQYFTQSLDGSEITLDGIPDETAWDKVQWAGDFTVWQPNEGEKPNQETRFKIMYDDKFLYVAYDCKDNEPHLIEPRMGRRDEFPGDWMEINIDSYHDLRTAFSFTLSASGVRNDEFVSQNGDNWDESFNPIWYAKTHINDGGWTAEVKIPFSQLRYDGDMEQRVWGIQVMRRLFRKEERSTWQYIPRKAGVWVSEFGELHGLRNVPPQRQVEIQPYVLGKSENYPSEKGNPFADGTDNALSAGLDAKVAVTSDLILDLTINPDFGQVEADPSQVRLDGFQNFFQERRPFFVESRNIFEQNLGNNLLFYSRRIGSSPQGYPDLSDDEYTDVPDNASILGAAKFSGKTKKGWSIGILESVTQRENATIDLNGERREELVEPFTNYFVGRVQKDINEGETVIGGILTGVNREDGLEDILHRSANTGGIDFQHYWKDRTWSVVAKGIFSHVEGTPEAIHQTQTSISHLFQRPDAGYIEVDSARTSLTGTGGRFYVEKTGGKQSEKGAILKFRVGGNFRSPELELNDIGFMQSADQINQFVWVGYHFIQPFGVFNSLRLNYEQDMDWDFGGNLNNLNYSLNVNGNFKNLWWAGGRLGINPHDVSNTVLQGAGRMRKFPGSSTTFWFGSNSSKKVSFSYEQTIAGAFKGRVRFRDYSLFLQAQPVDAMSISLGASYGKFYREQDQFVDNIDFDGTTRSIVGQIDQQTIRFTARLNYNITPDLTVQYYGQPFIFRPKYKNFAYVADPLSKEFNKRFHVFSENEISFNEEDEEFLIDENMDGETDYTFDKPDFNFVQFRSNLVLRWEYRMGSEVYLVWSQNNTPDAFGDLDTPLGKSLADNLFDNQATNIFLVKFTYRFLL